MPVPEPADMFFKSYILFFRDSEICIIYDVLTLSINFVIFIQAAVICETGPGSCRNVAVPVPEVAGMISRIMLFMILSLLFLFNPPQFFKMNPVVAGMWLQNWTRQ